MAEYTFNKGIGKPVEFKGLKSQYLFLFAGGLLADFVLFVVLFLAGAGQWACIAFAAVTASILVWQAFRMNGKYGEHGLMKRMALKNHPRYIINRIRTRRLFKRIKTSQP